MMMTTDTGTPERGNAQVAPFRYSQFKNLAAELSRPVSTLIALAPANDPFSITPSRRDGAHWFARIWKRLAIGLGVIPPPALRHRVARQAVQNAGWHAIREYA
jgi:hypothetical protein